MTLFPDKDEAVRSEYYESRQFSSQDIKGSDKGYGDLKHTYEIMLVDKPIYPCKPFWHHFQYRDEDGMLLGGKTHIIVFELSKLSNVIKKPIDEMTKQERWAVFFKYTTDREKRSLINEVLEREEEISMAGSLLQSLSADDHERARLLTEYKNAVDYQSGIVGARHEGREEGLKEGREQKQLEIAREMLLSGLPIEMIVKITKLDLEKIQLLENEMCDN